MTSEKLKELYPILADKKIDALLVMKGVNCSYLSGFEGEASAVLVSPRGNYIFTDSRFLQESKRLTAHFQAKITTESFEDALLQVLRRIKVSRLGFEERWVSYRSFGILKSRLSGISLVPTYNVIEELRMIKSPQEIISIKEAINICKAAFRYIDRIIKPGIKETELAAKIDNFMRERGSEGQAFPTIVASGINSLRPHAKPRNSKLKANDHVLIDIGAVYKGYMCDLTRTIHLGKITPTFKRIYELVREAQKRAIESIRPGVIISNIDNCARQYLTAQRVGKFFCHNLGHGVGREVHEAPGISKNNTGILKPGMVFTIEPALYIPRWGGVRIEDMLLVTNRGCEVLTYDTGK